MKTLDIIVLFIISVSYNIFVHQFTSLAFKNYSFEKREKYSTIAIIVAGILGLVASNLILVSNHQKYDENMVASGLALGGLILLLTALLINWNKINDAIKLILICIFFGGIIWMVSKKYEKYKNKTKN